MTFQICYDSAIRMNDMETVYIVKTWCSVHCRATHSSINQCSEIEAIIGMLEAQRSGVCSGAAQLHRMVVEVLGDSPRLTDRLTERVFSARSVQVQANGTAGKLY